MFKCGDKVIYKSFGVCTIEQTDYVLESMNSKGGDVLKDAFGAVAMVATL